MYLILFTQAFPQDFISGSQQSEDRVETKQVMGWRDLGNPLELSSKSHQDFEPEACSLARIC